MASIVKRKTKYCVVYNYTDENGNTKQKWETFDTNAAAKKRKIEVEYQQQTGEFIVPTANTVQDLLEEYVSVYGVNNWALSTYEARRSLMANYIIPIIGDLRLDSITPRTMDKYYQSLQQVKSKIVNNKTPKNEYLSAHVIREIHKLLRCAFNQAVKWELMTRNPVLNATLPKEEHEKREIWTVETLARALELCDDDILSLAINLSFSCSLRIGEMLGLTWDCVEIDEQHIADNNASVFINKEFQRVTNTSIDALDNKDIIFTFPATLTRAHTQLVLKTPKTKTSVRKVFLPNTVAHMLIDRKKQIEELKEIFGDEYNDYNLVFCHPTGRPMESQVINNALRKLIEKHNLPKVVFHSFRHASITYKLKWNGGDMKAVQGDSGHARMDMVADVYSHIIDDDRRYNAQKFDEQFYQAKGIRNLNLEDNEKTLPMPEFEGTIEELDPMAKQEKYVEMGKASAKKRGIEVIEPVEKKEESADEDTAALLTKLLQNPETANLLKVLAKNL